MDKPISRQKLIDFLTRRLESLQDQKERDFGGGLSDRLAKLQESKFLKGAIERGMFDEDEA
jgi:hypothetical protein